jgi:tol-pal system protein YbgF
MWFRLVLAGAVVGCAHQAKTSAEHTQELTDLRRQLAESQNRETDLQRKNDELQNRLFIMQDQLEAREVASTRKVTPRLPVDARADREEAPSPDIEYAGDAKDAHAPRPVLRLVGSQAPQKSTDVVGEMTPVPPPKKGAIKQEWNPPSDSGVDKLPVTHAVPPVPKAGQPVDRTGGGSPPPRRAELAGAPPPTGKAAPAVAQTPRATPLPVAPKTANESVDAMKLYTASVDLLKHGQHAEAIAGFEKFIKSYPTHDYADNAQYWLGECYYDQKDFKTALHEFRRVVQRYPSGNKAPDALLKVGYCYWQLQESGKARDVLEQVVKSYPGTEIAKKAQDKLSELK